MTNHVIEIVPQDGEIAACSVPGEQFFYRYAYARSSDFKTAHESGQDYIIIHRSESRLSFALCDGVSQSFYGDLAAHYLGNALSQWLWDIADTRPDEKELTEQLGMELLKQTRGAFEEVKNFHLPDDLSPMLINVLERKRALGSESMFVSGVLDFSTDYLALGWMGDSRLWLFDADGKPTIAFGSSFDTHERWSTSKGPVGAPHTFTGLTHDFKRIAAYSDGLAIIDKTIQLGSPDNATLNLLINKAGESPTSDDISFLEIWLGAFPNFNQGLSDWSLQLDIHTPLEEPASTTATAPPITLETAKSDTTPAVRPGQTTPSTTTQAKVWATPPAAAPKKRGNRPFWLYGGVIAVVVLVLAAASLAILPVILANPTTTPTLDSTFAANQFATALWQPTSTNTQSPALSPTNTNTQPLAPTPTSTNTQSPALSPTSTNTQSPASSPISIITPTPDGTPVAYAMAQESIWTTDLTDRSVEPLGSRWDFSGGNTSIYPIAENLGYWGITANSSPSE